MRNKVLYPSLMLAFNKVQTESITLEHTKKSKEFSSFVPWSSFCPKKIKLGVLVWAIKRPIKICSPEHLNDELKPSKTYFHHWVIRKILKFWDRVVEQTAVLNLSDLKSFRFTSALHTLGRLLSGLNIGCLKKLKMFTTRLNQCLVPVFGTRKP